MNKLLCYISLLVSSSFLLSTTAYAQLQNTDSIKIVNHYPGKLKFIITRYPEVLPDIHATTFELKKNQDISSSVSQGATYIRVEGVDETGREINAFWSVDSATGIHGYMDPGLAYSWNKKSNAQISFCHPNEFPCPITE